MIALSVLCRSAVVILVMAATGVISSKQGLRTYSFLLSFLYHLCGYKGYLNDLMQAVWPGFTLKILPFFLQVPLLLLHLIFLMYWLYEAGLVGADIFYRWLPPRLHLRSGKPSEDWFVRMILLAMFGRAVDYNLSRLEKQNLINFSVKESLLANAQYNPDQIYYNEPMS